MARADVVIIGGGIVGLSIAYQLSQRDAGQIVVLEKGAGVAEGSTGASSACIRLRYSHNEVVRLAQHGMEIYKSWASFTGLPSPRAGFQHTGVLWMLGEDRATVESEHARLAATGARVSILDAAGVEQRFPALSTCGTLLDLEAEEHACNRHDRFLFEEDGGYCTDPAGANQDLLDAARRNGVDVRLGCAVAGIRTKNGRVQQVDLADGSSLSAGVVINAAGPWCNAINTMAGLELSWTLRPTRVQVLFRVLAGPIPGGLPLVADTAGGIYFRPESQAQQILVGSIRPEDELEEVGNPDDFDRSLDSDMRERLLAALHHRVPSLEHRGRVTGVAGLYTMTEQDVHPIVGPTAIDGFVVANGFSGHGFKLAPAIGSMLAQWITGRRTELDTDVPIEFLSLDRESLQVREKSVLA